MRARSLTSRGLVLLGVVAGVLAFAAIPAFASKEYVQGGSFGEACSSTPCGKGQFNEPMGVAVNDSKEPLVQPAAGDVYVVDKGDDRVERFSSTGFYLGQFDGSGTFEVEGKVEKGAGAPSGQLSGPTHVAVDDSGKTVLEDPSVGDVYVVDSGHGVIDKFSASGEYLGQLTETSAGTSFSKLAAVAVDPSGNLWALEEVMTEATPEDNADEFSDTGVFVQSFADVDKNSGAESAILGADSKDIYVGQANTVFKLDSATGKQLASFHTRSFGGQGVQALALNPATDNLVLASNEIESEPSNTSLWLYGAGGEPYGEPLQTLPAEPPLASSFGVAVSGAGTVYASQQGEDNVRIFEDVLFPSVGTELATVTDGGVTLHGIVDTEGEEVVECQFEYGAEGEEYSHVLPCAPGTPFSANEASVAVSASPAGLEPDIAYHFRLTARAAATKNSPEDTFFTSTGPLVEAETSTGVGATVATVGAKVDAAGLQTSYHVEYGTSEAYGSSTADITISALKAAQAASLQLSGLQPGTEYHFRFVASNAFGATDGTDQTFITPASTGAFSSALPDGRVYELVSTSGNIGEVYSPPDPSRLRWDTPTEYLSEAASNGDAVAYLGEPAATGGNGEIGNGLGNDWLARRGGAGWTTADIIPRGAGTEITFYETFSSDLSRGILHTNLPSLTANAPVGCDLLYSSDLSGVEDYSPLLAGTKTPVSCGHPDFSGASADWSQLIFESEAALTENAQEATEIPAGHEEEHSGESEDRGESCEYGCNLYDLVNGQLRLVNVLPGPEHKPVANATFGGPPGSEKRTKNPPDFSNAISSDGSRIFWTDTQSGPQMEHIYVLENGTDSVQVSGEGPALYWTATPDGRYAFYTEAEKLWRFDTDTNTREELEGEALNRGEGLGVQGVIGVNSSGEDGAYLYFVATGVLADNENASKESAISGEGNLYLLHDGLVTFIASGIADTGIQGTGTELSRSYGDLERALGTRTAEVTPDGQHLVFESIRPLTGYDNAGAGEGESLDTEVYVYAADTRRLVCASCDPSGKPPQLVTTPNSTLLPVSQSNTTMRRWISEDGSRVFFETKQPLVPNDTNGLQDLYEWEREGTPGCPEATPARRDEGCVFLLSGGESADNSFFVDAGANGNDVFFATRGQLVLQDRDEKMDLYDARVDGYQPVSPPSCSGTGCQGVPPGQPIFATPSSTTFAGVGNFEAAPATVKPKSKPKVCRKGFARKHGKCVKAKAKVKKHRGKARKSSGRSNRRSK